jgi:hypothetical protein
MSEPETKPISLMNLSVGVSPWTHIEHVRLISSSLRSHLTETSVPLRLEYSISAKTTVDSEAKTLTVRASLMTCASGVSESGDSEEIVRIEAEFVLIYNTSLPRAFTADEADAFGKMNGIHNVWPYWREYVQSTTARIGMPPLTLPLITGASLVQYYSNKASET